MITNTNIQEIKYVQKRLPDKQPSTGTAQGCPSQSDHSNEPAEVNKVYLTKLLLVTLLKNFPCNTKTHKTTSANPQSSELTELTSDNKNMQI